LNYTKYTQVVLLWAIFFLFFCRLLRVIFLQRDMAEQQYEHFVCCVLAEASWAGGTHTERTTVPGDEM